MTPITVTLLELTQEDYDAWSLVAADNTDLYISLRLSSSTADRRDARICRTMEEMQRLSGFLRPPGYPNYCIAFVLMRAEFKNTGSYDWIPALTRPVSTS